MPLLLLALYFASVATCLQAAIIPLGSIGNHYGISITVMDDVKGIDAELSPLIVDTGSAGVYIMRPAFPPSILDNLTGLPTDDVTVLGDLAAFTFHNNENVSLSVSLSSLPFPPNGTTVFVTIAQTLVPSTVQHWWDGGLLAASGVFGLLLTPTAPAASLLPDSVLGLNFTAPWRPYAQDNSSTSALFVGTGSIPSTTLASLVWSELLPLITPSPGYVFTMFRFGACGIESAVNYSSHFLAVVNTSSACLTLPAEVFDAAIGWLPVICAPTPPMTPYPTCVYAGPNISTADAAAPQFVLQFRLSEDGPLLLLDLLDLLLLDHHPAAFQGQYVCMLKGSSLRSSQVPLVLGSMALRSLFTVVNVSSHRIAFANKAFTEAQPPNYSACQAVHSCAGLQSLYVPANICTPPECASYFFQEVDPVSQTCTYVSLSIVYLHLSCELIIRATIRRPVVPSRSSSLSWLSWSCWKW